MLVALGSLWFIYVNLSLIFERSLQWRWLVSSLQINLLYALLFQLNILLLESWIWLKNWTVLQIFVCWIVQVARGISGLNKNVSQSSKNKDIDISFGFIIKSNYGQSGEIISLDSWNPPSAVVTRLSVQRYREQAQASWGSRACPWTCAWWWPSGPSKWVRDNFNVAKDPLNCYISDKIEGEAQ